MGNDPAINFSKDWVFSIFSFTFHLSTVNIVSCGIGFCSVMRLRFIYGSLTDEPKLLDILVRKITWDRAYFRSIDRKYTVLIIVITIPYIQLLHQKITKWKILIFQQVMSECILQHSVPGSSLLNLVIKKKLECMLRKSLFRLS